MKDSEKKYLNEHHGITESAIGLAKCHLIDGDPDKALEMLNKCCKALDGITIKYHPYTSKMTGLIKRVGN